MSAFRGCYLIVSVVPISEVFAFRGQCVLLSKEGWSVPELFRNREVSVIQSVR